MSEDIIKFTFTFEKEAEDLRQSLGPKFNNLIFIETAVTPQKNAGEQPGLRMLPVGDVAFMNVHGEEAFEAIFSNYGPSSGVASLKKGGGTFGYAIGMRESESFTEAFGEDKKAFMRLFGLLHETGHVLIGGPSPKPNNPYSECAADAYAALVCLQRFGNDAAELLSLIGWGRIIKSIVADTKHLTTPVLDKIIADSATEDFSQLSQAEIVDLAKQYAKDWTPKASVLAASRPDFVQNGLLNWNKLVENCLSSTSSDFSFYIGERFFHPYMNPEGRTFEGTRVTFPDDYRHSVDAAIQARAGGRTAQEIFNAAMPKPAARFRAFGRGMLHHTAKQTQTATILP